MPAKRRGITVYPSDLDEQRFSVIEKAEQYRGLPRSTILRELLREKAGSLSNGRTKTQQLDELLAASERNESRLAALAAEFYRQRELLMRYRWLLKKLVGDPDDEALHEMPADEGADPVQPEEDRR